jgi:hypothetical protein
VFDVANNITGLLAQPYLTTLMMSLMDQATTPFTVVCSFAMLGTRYTLLETTSVLMLICAAVSGAYVASQDSTGSNSGFWAVEAALTTSFAAVSFVLKEKAFNQYGESRKDVLLDVETMQRTQTLEQYPNSTLDIFVVSLIVSAGGALTGVPVALVSRYLTTAGSPVEAMREGFGCLLHCKDALPMYILYTVINFMFNFCLLALTGQGSALLSFLSLKLVVPLTALCSAFPWPLIGSVSVSNKQWMILIIMLSALGGFRIGNLQRLRHGYGCCWPLCQRNSPATSGNKLDEDVS